MLKVERRVSSSAKYLLKANHKSARAFSTSKKEVAVIDGARIPFTLAGTAYKDYLSYDLARLVIKGLLARNQIDPAKLDSVIWGTVVQEVRTSNLGREAALGAGIPASVPAYTVSQACISASRAICSGAEKIQSGHGEFFLCGGSETFSDVPIRYSKPIRERLLKANKAMKQGPLAVLKLLRGLKLADLAPEPPAIKNFSTNEVMGHSSDRLASRFGISRSAQDEFALKSHQNAQMAHDFGFYKQELIPVQGSIVENGIRGDSTLESLGKLKPAFVKPHGTHTAANSSFLTDGAAACLIGDREAAKNLGLPVKSIIRDFVFVGVDPFESMLLGPAFGIEQILKRNKLEMKDISVIELHEAFAGQCLANIAQMDILGLKVDMTKVNKWGGSLSIGHPFGATGARLVTTATNRLIQEDGKFALIAACADGGLAHACLIERV